MERTFDVTAPDGRTLCVHEDGDSAGAPIVVHHGTPGSGGHYAAHVALARERGLRLIGYDRPGYGGSTPRRGRTVADAVGDVAAILDARGAERFATWGGSGGGPHALACAALLGDRCAGAATIAAVAPYEAEGLDWLAGQGESNLQEWQAALDGRDALTAFCEHEAQQLRGVTPEQLVAALRSLLSDVDAACVTETLGEYLIEGLAHGLAPGVEGWVDDDYAFMAPWGFDLGAIGVPVQAWQGEHDLMVPPAHGRWLGEHVAGVDVRLSPADGHISLIETRMNEVFDFLGEALHFVK
jgi:pimeloyl-ACP methyl ester carboxylesterase